MPSVLSMGGFSFSTVVYRFVYRAVKRPDQAAYAARVQPSDSLSTVFIADSAPTMEAQSQMAACTMTRAFSTGTA